MNPFMSAKESDRKQAGFARACNPAPGRSPKHYQRITRALDAIAARTQAFLDATGYADREWLPYKGAVHEKDDEWQYDLYAQVHPDGHSPDHDGHLPTWTDPGIRATNRIKAITWYQDTNEDAFLIKKTILSPLPCDTWGRLPVTLAQWRRIAPVLIEAEARWRWVHAVRHYTDKPTMALSGVAGWHLDVSKSVTSMERLAKEGRGYIIDMRPEHEREQESERWIGASICLDIIAGFSLSE